MQEWFMVLRRMSTPVGKPHEELHHPAEALVAERPLQMNANLVGNLASGRRSFGALAVDSHQGTQLTIDIWNNLSIFRWMILARYSSPS